MDSVKKNSSSFLNLIQFLIQLIYKISLNHPFSVKSETIFKNNNLTSKADPQSAKNPQSVMSKQIRKKLRTNLNQGMAISHFLAGAKKYNESLGSFVQENMLAKAYNF